MDRYVSIVGVDHYFGVKIFKVGQELKLQKDYDNKYDDEAIYAELETVGKVGYVANSYHTVAKGTQSAGRIYETFPDNCHCKIIFIVDNTVIAKIFPQQPEE